MRVAQLASGAVKVRFLARPGAQYSPARQCVVLRVRRAPRLRARSAVSPAPARSPCAARLCRLLLLATGESSFPAGRFSALYVLEQTAAGAMFVRAEVLRFGAGAR